MYSKWHSQLASQSLCKCCVVNKCESKKVRLYRMLYYIDYQKLVKDVNFVLLVEQLVTN